MDYLDKPMRLGVVRGWWGWQRELPGKKLGETRSPSPEMGVEMFELVQLNLFTPERKKGWPPTGDSSPTAGRGWAWGDGARTWTWTLTWSALMDLGGFNPEAANRGVYAGMVHGIASRPKSKPKPAATPATRAPPQPHPPGRLRQGLGGHLPRPGPPRHCILSSFER